MRMNISWQCRAVQNTHICDILIEWGWLEHRKQHLETVVLKTQSRLRPRSWADSSQSNPNAKGWQSFFSRCVRKSMWWKASFPPKHRQLSCCSFYLGWSINLHPDLARATALLRGGLMCSTSPLMEALPRLSHISKTDTLGFPLRAKAHHCCHPFEAEECLFPWQSFAPQSV